MNIFEAYLKKYGQMIILILGMPCTNKSEIAKELALDLNVPLVKINDYLIENKYIEKDIEGIKYKLFEHSESYNWEKLNKDINDKKSTGVIIYGNYLDINNIDFEINFSFFFNMNNGLCKKILIEKKLLPFSESDEKVKIYFEKIFNPIYENIKTEFKINKYFNIKDNTTFDESYDELFDLLMKLIEIKLKK